MHKPLAKKTWRCRPGRSAAGRGGASRLRTPRSVRPEYSRSVAINLPGGKKLVTTAVPVKGDPRSVCVRSVIALVGKTGRRTLWKPGAEYVHGAMWHCDAQGNLYGYDFRHPDRVYICRLDGRHVATLHLRMLRKNILKPVFFRTSSRGIRYSAANGLKKALTWRVIEQILRRRDGAAQTRHAMRWLTGG